VSDTTTGGGALSHREILIVFSGLMAGLLVAALDQTIVATALPTIVGDLGGLNHLSWVVTAYLLTSTVSVPLYGKVSDLLGRKIVFQAAIVIFVAGSMLAGLSQNMLELVLFRALQGVGGGGLISMAQAIIGDIVAPRERGKYQGYLGAVFAFASVVGPLLGGWFVDHLTWRWVFYVNVPVGAMALLVTSSVLNVNFRRVQHAIDYLGAALVMGSATCLLLVTVWGGVQYPWGSPTIIGLAIVGVVLLVLFIVQEGRAAEPVIPLRLWRDPVFSVASGLEFLVGFAMFGAIIFLPLYLQTVGGASAENSGLLILPLMAGLMISSIGSGRMITRTGRYKRFPIVGTATIAVAMYLMSTMGVGTSRITSSLYMVVLGLGIGMIHPGHGARRTEQRAAQRPRDRDRDGELHSIDGRCFRRCHLWRDLQQPACVQPRPAASHWEGIGKRRAVAGQSAGDPGASTSDPRAGAPCARAIDPRGLPFRSAARDRGLPRDVAPA
jgi:EmrB/QacA subfamily drug resistance transporter